MTQLYQNKIKKIVLNGMFLALLTAILLVYVFKRNNDVYHLLDFYFYTNAMRLFTYCILGIATIFSIHNWVLLPKYFAKQFQEYKYWYIAIEVAFVGYLAVLFELNITYDEYGWPFYVIFIPLFIIASVFINLFYTAFFSKRIRRAFLEFTLNAIVFVFFYAIVISSNKIEVLEVFWISVITFYVHTFFIVPLTFKKQKAKYISSVIAISLLSLIAVVSALNFNGLYEFQSVLRIVFVLIGSLVILLLLSFIYGYYRIKLKQNTLKLENKDSELTLLKSQVNPHFLFNTLNTLYALALNENAPKTAETTAKLANLLRYMETDMKKEYIPVTDEIKCLEDYIAIQKTRCAIEPEVRFTTKNVSKTVRISPGLFIPLVENAFKHGIHLVEKSALTISISCDEKQVHFMCANTYDENSKVHQMEKGFGIGIQNVQKRLELLYASDYTFEIDKQNRIFTVNLSIPRR